LTCELTCDSNLAYPRRLRLTGSADFSRVFKKNISCGNQHFRILAQTGNGLGFARLGQVVSRKVDRRAVARNRIKRLVRESFRSARVPVLQKGLQQPETGVDFVVLAQRNAARENNNQLLRASLLQLWQQIETKISREPGKAK